MQPAILATFFEFSRTAVSMSSAGFAVFLIAMWAAKTDIARATGLDKIVALSNLCFAIPLAFFGAEHLSGAKFLQLGVPAYMPWRLFWAYFVGFALLAASLSIATKILVRWSGLLFGIMMTLFVAMIHLPRAIANPKDRIAWVIVCREMSFAAGGWLLASTATRGQGKNVLFTIGRVLVAIAAISFGIQHFFHPANCPGVPLEKLMPTYIPARLLIGYLTGAFLLAAGACILLARATRSSATYLGAWLLFVVLFVYVPIMIVQMASPDTAVKVEGLNYFADTLLFTGAILALASATHSRTTDTD